MSVTIVMPLKGRIEFTLRFLRHVELCRMPFRFFLADGLVRGLKDKLQFPEVNIRYIPYPDDIDWNRYFRKLHDAISRVETPFVMMAENDDFLGAQGIKDAVDFLCTHSDYVCCGGGVAGFSINEGLLGPLSRLSYSYTGDCKGDGDSDDVKARVLSGFKCNWLFYAVYRTEVLKAIWEEIVDMNPSNFYVTEHFQTLRALSLGKAHLIQSVTNYFKQANTSLAGHWRTSESAPEASFVYHFLRSRFNSDFDTMIERIAQDEEFAEQLRLAAEPWLGRLFENNYGLRVQVLQRMPRLRQWFERPRNTIKRDRKRIRKVLWDNGAKVSYMRQFNFELGAIESVLKDRKLRGMI